MGNKKLSKEELNQFIQKVVAASKIVREDSIMNNFLGLKADKSFLKLKGWTIIS